MIPLSDFRSASVSGVIADGAAGIGRKATEKERALSVFLSRAEAEEAAARFRDLPEDGG